MSKFYEYIEESLWGNIRDRVNGDTERKEDEVPEHIKKVLSRYIELFALRVYYRGDYTVGSRPDFIAFVKDYANNIRIDELHPDIPELIGWIKEHWDDVIGLCERAVEKVEKDENVLADNLWDELHKDEGVSESLWGSVRDRVNGDTERKEDDINNLDIDGFYEYLESLDSVKVYIDSNHKDFISVDDIILSATKRKRLFLVMEYSSGKVDLITLPYSFSKEYPDVYKKMFDEYILDIPKVDTPEEEDDALNTGFIEVAPKNGSPITNKFFLEVLNFILINCGLSGINESLWGNIRDRVNGDDKRSEDVVKLDDKYVNKFERCLKFFVEDVVYCENYKNNLNDFKKYIKNDTKRFGEVWVGNTTVPLSDILLPYIEDNWNQYDDIQKQINERVLDVNSEIRKLGFKKEPGKTIEDTLCEWWDSLDDDKKYDIIIGWCEDDIMSRFYETHLDDDEFTADDVDVDDEWDKVAYIKQVEIYMKESHMDESLWGSIRDRVNGETVRNEDYNLSLIRHFALMFKNTVAVCSNPKNPVTFHYDDTCDDFVEYILRRKKDHTTTDGSGKELEDKKYDDCIKYIKINWKDCKGIEEFMERYLNNLNECDGVPGGLTPADVGGMGPAYFPGPNGEPGSGDLPSPTGIVYHQVAPFGVFIKELKSKKKKKKKKFRKEDEPCAKYDNPPIYSHVDDFRDYVDRTYTMVNKKK